LELGKLEVKKKHCGDENPGREKSLQRVEKKRPRELQSTEAVEPDRQFI